MDITLRGAQQLVLKNKETRPMTALAILSSDAVLLDEQCIANTLEIARAVTTALDLEHPLYSADLADAFQEGGLALMVRTAVDTSSMDELLAARRAFCNASEAAYQAFAEAFSERDASPLVGRLAA